MRRSGVARRDPERGAAGVDEGGRHRLRGSAGAEHEHARALGLDRVGDRLPVRARPQHAPVADDERVHRAGALGDGVELVAVGEHGGLVRDGDVGAREAERHEARDRLLEALGLDAERDVGPVEPGRLEGGVLHAGRERVPERMAEQADERRRARSAPGPRAAVVEELGLARREEVALAVRLADEVEVVDLGRDAPRPGARRGPGSRSASAAGPPRLRVL